MNRYRPFAPGDVNAFFGLMLDNVANLLLCVGLLSTTYNFPATFTLRYMLPGTAVGVLVGDLIFTSVAIRLARRTGHKTMTSMPLGIDTPSTLGMVFFVLGPAFVAGQKRGLDDIAAAENAWHIGVCTLLASGLFKLAVAPVAGWIRRTVPRAGLLGSLAAIALVLISFLPFLEVMRHPVGILHSPLPASPLLLPWNVPIESMPFAGVAHTPVVMASAYAAMALTVLAGGYCLGRTAPEKITQSREAAKDE